jgi:glycosyltransferase involved in cell wall biosynthesis
MKFAVMARSLKYEQSGIHTLLHGLIKGISNLEPNHKFFFLIDPLQNIPQLPDNGLFEVVRISPPTDMFFGRFIWDHVSVGLACKKYKIDALFAPAHMRPAYTPCPAVVQVLDMMYHKFPQQWQWWDQAYFRFGVSMLTKRASKIIAISESTKRDLLELLSIPENKVKVIYPGVSEAFCPLDNHETQVIREKCKLYKPFILCISSFHPRKNIIGLVEAFEKIAHKIVHDLVIKVTSNWRMDSLGKKIVNSTWKERIHIIDDLLTPTELAYLYNETDLFVFPSLYEGFGFPVLEALACGTPTITTNVSSIPEIVGEAAVLVPPGDTTMLSDGIYRLLSDRVLLKGLSQSAIIRAKTFSWKNYALKTVEVLEEATCF